MFVVITGNVNPEETLEIIRNNQNQKKFDKLEKIKQKTYDEPDNVEKNVRFCKKVEK